jgi:hypothetical protein
MGIRRALVGLGCAARDDLYKLDGFHGSYTAPGTDGQYITVIPLHDMVVAHKNAHIDQTPDRDVNVIRYQTILQMLVDAHCGGCN